MDNATHTLVGLTLARSPLGRAGRGTTAALLLASNAPDIDVLAAVGGAGRYLQWHRGPTHGLPGGFVLALATAGVVWAGRRLLGRSSTEPDASFGRLLTAAVVGVLLHILMDLPTVYGTRVLSPFDWHWFAADWLPIIDLYLLAALAAGLWVGAAPRRRRLATIAVVLFALGDYGLRAAAHRAALGTATRLLGLSLPARCAARSAASAWGLERWPRDTPARQDGPDATACVAEVAAMPTFGSPFKWRVIVQLAGAYEVRDVDLLETWRAPDRGASGFWRRVVRYPNQWTPAVTAAARTTTGRVFLGFARFPAARSLVDTAGAATVRWSDVRFSGDGLPTLGGSAPWTKLLTARVHLSADGSVLEEQVGAGDRPSPPSRTNP